MIPSTAVRLELATLAKTEAAQRGVPADQEVPETEEAKEEAEAS